MIPQLKFTKGMIAGLQNLLPGTENEESNSDIYCHAQGFAGVQFFDMAYLKLILSKDLSKLHKLWTLLAYRMVIINYAKLKQFASLTQDKVKMFCKMNEIRIYMPGDIIDLKNGGILLRGGLSALNSAADEA
jgi:hypothetical protein